MKDLIIFSDAGIDDIVAIQHLLENNQVNAIIATVGNGSAERAYDVLAYFFKEYTNIYLGSTKKGEVHKVHRALESLKIPSVSNYNIFTESIDKIFLDTVKVLSIAPMTDLANIIDRISSVKEIVLMGGAYHVAGNANMCAEYNFMQDAWAAKKVVLSTVKKTIISLDITNQLRFRQHHINLIKQSEIRCLLNGLLDHYRTLGDDSFPLHDLTAALYITNPESFTLKPRYCDVSTSGETHGALIVDEHRYQRKAGNSYFVSEIDVTSLHYAFLQSGEGRTPIEAIRN